MSNLFAKPDKSNPAIYVRIPFLDRSLFDSGIKQINRARPALHPLWTEQEIHEVIASYKLGEISHIELTRQSFDQEAIVYMNRWNANNPMAVDLYNGNKQFVDALYGKRFILFRHAFPMWGEDGHASAPPLNRTPSHKLPMSER